MADTVRRAVITGLGVATPLGLDLVTFWDGLRAGRSGVRRLRNIDIAPSFPLQIGAEIDGFDPRAYLDKKDRKRLPVMVRTFQLAVAAARMAMQHAGLTGENLDPARLGAVVGAGTIPSELVELGRASQATANCKPMVVDVKKWGAEGLPLIPPMWMLHYIPNMLGCHVSMIHNAQGPSNTVTQTDIGSLLALGEAWRMIRHGKADAVLVGSADAKINAVTLVRQVLFAPLSQCQDEPAQASRPFDRQRDGIVLGEGGAMLVLEDLEHARRRGASILAEMTGFGAAFDRSVDRLVGRWPRGTPRERRQAYPPRGGANGIFRAVQAALDGAGITAADLDHVNAQGYSTIADDIWEAQSLAARLPGLPVFAAKSYFGSLGAGGGAVELAASLLAMQHGILPATLNYEEPDPDCPIPVSASAQPVRRRHFLKIGFTELGQVAAVVCRKWD